jgi:hypothetical protein
MSEIWSNTDFPYMCLKDRRRTEAFAAAIADTVRPGDTVVDIGSGTGIMALLAVRAGAAHVYAVEIDSIMAAALHDTVRLNGLDDRIAVIEADAAEARLPTGVDVVIAELIETGLIDEQQVPVMNALHARGVIDAGTRLIPGSYTTTLEPVVADHRYYGFLIVAPKHEWPFYATDPGWIPTAVRSLDVPATICHADFGAQIDPLVSGAVRFSLTEPANAIRVAGRMTLAAGNTLGPSHAVNGDKVLAIPPIRGPVDLHYSYEMGAGLRSLALRCEPLPSALGAPR